MSEEKKYPSLTVGVYIFNKKGELFLMRAPHWSDKLVIPGGHVDYGESVEDAVIRETKEEVGLDVGNLEFLKVEEIKDSKEYKKNKHIVSIAYKATLKDEKQEVVLDGREAMEYFWIKPKDVLKRDDIEGHTYNATKELFVDKNPKSYVLGLKSGKKKCKNCDKSETEMEEYKSGWLRATADYKNLQKEISEQRSQWAQMSEQTILEEFIPVYDNFKLAFGHQIKDSSQEVENWKKGIEYIMKQFGKVLEDHGVVEIRTVGELFNADMHEAVEEQESDESSGRILREVSGGYTMKGKVIKVARVVVAK